MGILDKYKEQLSKDMENENNNFPENSSLTESQRADYEKKLHELRNNPNDMANAYHKKMTSMEQMSEKDMEGGNLIKEEEIKKIIVKHAYCKECGEELISNAPPMFNPFTFERVCKHTCSKCGKIYNLEFAYPRLAFINNGDEIAAFTR